jgi:hypothetical protein
MRAESVHATPTNGSSGRQRVAVVIPVGATSIEVARCNALLWSLLRWEPAIGWTVIVENRGTRPSGLAELPYFQGLRNAVRLEADAVSVKVLTALRWIHANTDADFILKIDTDALVIGRFVDKIRECIVTTPEAGLIGAIGLSCNDAVRWRRNLRLEPDLLRLNRQLPETRPANAFSIGDKIRIPALGTVAPEIFNSFKRVRCHITDAIRNGYASDEYCQGGAMVIVRKMVDRMAAANYLAHAEEWQNIPVSDDRILPMYAHAVQMAITDKSRPGEPFGVQWRGLAYPPQELADVGYSLIHSVKNDAQYSEVEIREFFRERAANACRKT